MKRSWECLLCAACLAAMAAPLLAQSLPATTAQAVIPVDSRMFQVGKILVKYDPAHAGQPPVEEFDALVLTFTETANGLTSGDAEGKHVTYTLAELNGAPPRGMDWPAIESVCKQVLKHLNDKGFVGVQVGPDSDDISAEVDPQTGRVVPAKDLRAADNTDLHIVIHTASVTGIRTVAVDNQGNKRINQPEFANIARNSPLQPGKGGDSPLLRQDALDDYVLKLNRFPGRHVDAAIAAGENPENGDVGIDYLVTQKPFSAFAEISNTGTKQTAEWRETFGAAAYQLLNNNDILSFSGTTTSFDETYGLTLSYEGDVPNIDRLRFRINGLYSKYDASQLGLNGQNLDGEEWSAGGDLIYNLFQKKALFVDAIVGARYRHIFADNRTSDIVGATNFFLPHIGMLVQEVTPTESTTLSGDFEFSVPAVADTSQSEIDKFGRNDVSDAYTSFTWSAAHSFYLEPLLNQLEFHHADMEHPENSSPWATLAHEVAFEARGQTTFNDRVIPQSEYVIGGFHTVRGYPEDIAAGDSAIVGTAEYRFHVPRVFRPQPTPGRLFNSPFRYAPQQPYGNADWDLILRAFIDAGYVINVDRESFEHNDTLIGTGVGMELVLWQNASFRVDYGIPLHDTPDVKAGSGRFHFSFEFAY